METTKTTQNSQTTSPSKSAVSFGILFGAIMVLEMLVMYALDIDPTVNPMVGVIINLMNYLLLPVTFILVAANQYKKKFNNGFISLVDSLKIGVSINAIAALIFGIFYIIFVMLFPEYLDDLTAKTAAFMEKQNPEMTSEQIEVALGFQRKFMEPQLMVPIALAIYSFLGLIYSLIIGAIIKKERP
jgi:hypothetical protein